MEKQRWIIKFILSICFEMTVKLRCRALAINLLTLLLCWSMCNAATCLSSITNLATISTEQFIFSSGETQTSVVVDDI